MKVLKKIETDMWINVIMMFLIGVLFIVRPQNSLESVAIIAGIIIFVNGIFDLFYDIKIWTDFYIRYSLFEGIMKCILGIFIATHAGIITILFSYVFSIYIIINGIICMETAVYMRSIFKVNSGIYIVLSGFEVLGGIIMMFISPGLFGTINHYDANGKKVGESRPGFFGGMNNFDVNGKKIGHSSPSFFGGMNYYDNKGQKVGESRPGIFGGVNYYDKKGHKKGHSNPGFFGGFNHYDD